MTSAVLTSLKVVASLGRGANDQFVDQSLTSVPTGTYLVTGPNGRPTVAKKWSEGHSPDPEVLLRLRESRDRHVASFREYEAADGYVYAFSEFIDGQTAWALADKGAVPIQTVVKIGTQLCSALQNLHNHGLVHRDVKPANIVLTRKSGEVSAVLIDFGAATMTGRHKTQSLTPEYTSPEMFHSSHTTAAADVYSLSATLWSLVSGEVPPIGTLSSVINSVLERGELEPATELFFRALGGAAEPDPGRRSTIATLAAHLRRAAEVLPREELFHPDWIVTVTSPSKTVRMGPDSRVTVGRMASCDIPIKHEEVSRLMLEIQTSGRQLLIRGLGANGSFIKSPESRYATLISPAGTSVTSKFAEILLPGDISLFLESGRRYWATERRMIADDDSMNGPPTVRPKEWTPSASEIELLLAYCDGIVNHRSMRVASHQEAARLLNIAPLTARNRMTRLVAKAVSEGVIKDGPGARDDLVLLFVRSVYPTLDEQ